MNCAKLQMIFSFVNAWIQTYNLNSTNLVSLFAAIINHYFKSKHQMVDFINVMLSAETALITRKRIKKSGSV